MVLHNNGDAGIPHTLTQKASPDHYYVMQDELRQQKPSANTPLLLLHTYMASTG
jgi:hypothetical protein